MGININTPQIIALRNEVERIFGKITSHSYLQKLSEEIEYKCKEHVSVSTLERLWNYSTRNVNNISVRILDIISCFVGAENWEHFCQEQQPLYSNPHPELEHKTGRQFQMPANGTGTRTVHGLFHSRGRGDEQQHRTLCCGAVKRYHHNRNNSAIR